MRPQVPETEGVTIAASDVRFRVSYGTLLCVPDKPLHGELKLPGVESDFYREQVARHLLIGVRAMERLRDTPLERIHPKFDKIGLSLAQFSGPERV